LKKHLPDNSMSGTGDAEKHFLETQLLKRPTKPEDIAAAVAFMASDEASMITLRTLAVNGGEYLH
jgi:2-hydroxycyclohexanecarboxyl-CoA dehydrogenase